MQLIETATQDKDKNEIVHEGSGTTDTLRTCGDSHPLSDKLQSDGVSMSSTHVTVPSAIANRKPTSASREADTHVKRHEGLKYKLTDPYRPAFLSGEKVLSLGGMTGRIVMTDQQGCSTNTRREGRQQN